MKRSNLAVIVSTTVISLFLITGVAFSGDNIFPASGNVGIGTTSPGEKLHIHNSATGSYTKTFSAYTMADFGLNPDDNGFVTGLFNYGGTPVAYVWNRETGPMYFGTDNAYRMTITSDGNVGIRTTSPAEELEVAGGGDMILNDVNAGGNPNLTFQDEGVNIGRIYAEDDDTTLRLRGGDTYDAIIIKSNGNVGIGTTTPDYKLDVFGTIRAKEVLVATGWYDFVFDDNYNLPSLAHVESYIEENKHLPDMPSAKEIQENGLSMAEMIGKQMQKIEELTLYVIEQNKQINELKDELAELKKTN